MTVHNKQDFMWYVVPRPKVHVELHPGQFCYGLFNGFQVLGFIFYGIKQAGNPSMSHLGYVFFCRIPGTQFLILGSFNIFYIFVCSRQKLTCSPKTGHLKIEFSGKINNFKNVIIAYQTYKIYGGTNRFCSSAGRDRSKKGRSMSQDWNKFQQVKRGRFQIRIKR